VDSLAPLLTEPLKHRCTIIPSRMRLQDRRICRWIGFGLGKGVTHPERDLSVFTSPPHIRSAAHGEMIQGFRGIRVDPSPFCYEALHRDGFGGFVRWASFADPVGGPGFLGIDWSYRLRPTGGVAHTMLRAWQTCRALADHGFPRNAEVVLLNWRMIEIIVLQEWRRAYGLITLQDWLEKGRAYFAQRSRFCPRCGSASMNNPHMRYCGSCGCKVALVRKLARTKEL
jgi:ribosomal protein S27AE